MSEQKQAVAISLEASRCPDATIHMRRVIQWFMEQEQSTLNLESIEPSLVRSLPAYVQVEQLPVEVKQADPRQITDEDKAKWEEKYDEDDFGDVEVVNTFILTKKAA
ncbi:MAG: hypothetical protein CL840_00915 [Crocinitomicaceae bacterium]|nr:hypothetical protein [Crocinitomicaceae bacterium]|tara:strand:- start:96377 stop:96697 length:321 start_codon:yes stop_codon:yes gene_type:complete